MYVWTLEDFMKIKETLKNKWTVNYVSGSTCLVYGTCVVSATEILNLFPVSQKLHVLLTKSNTRLQTAFQGSWLDIVTLLENLKLLSYTHWHSILKM